MNPTNRFRTLVLALLAISSSIAARAQGDCLPRPTVPIVNSAVGFQASIMGAPDDTLETKFWIVGAGSDNNSGSLATTTMVTGTGQLLPTMVYPWTNWGNTGVHVTWPHPAPACDRTAFLYSFQDTSAGLGAAGYYLVMSVKSDGSMFDFDTVTNGHGLGLAPTAIPQPRVQSLRRNKDNSFDVGVAWTPVADRKGYFDEKPADLITGVAVYFRIVEAGSPIDSLAIDDWDLARGGPNDRSGYVIFDASDPGSAIVRVPSLNNPKAQIVLAMSVLFDGGVPGSFLETDFVGQPSGAIAQGPARQR